MGAPKQPASGDAGAAIGCGVVIIIVIVLGIVFAFDECSRPDNSASVGSSSSATTAESAPPTVATSSQQGFVGTKDDKCGPTQPANQASPDFYRDQYEAGLEKMLARDISVYDSAIETGDPQQIGDAAGTLYSTTKFDADMLDSQRLFGCYDAAVLGGVHNATDVFAATLNDLACAGKTACGKTPDALPALLAAAATQEKIYIEAMNAYASQFDGPQIPS